jgi:ATP-binding cassette subfamily F protein uup
MSLLLSCQSIQKSFGTRSLFQDLSLSIFAKDRIGLIGPNGSGKSTLLKILAGIERPDQGLLSPRKGLIIGYIPQECEFAHLSPQQVLIDAAAKDLPIYEKERLAEMWLSKLGFSGDEPKADLLSGGWKKRLGLAAVLITSPDLLLLDEPTNHLDLEGILWLEKFLMREAPTYLLVSHDRYFLQNATNRIIEINPAYPKGMFAIDGSYSDFLLQKETFLEGQIQQEKSLATKARRETEWLRAGVKARTTKSQSRIDEAHQILKEHKELRHRNKEVRAKLEFTASERETRKLLVGKNLSVEVSGRPLFTHLDFVLSPGTRLGLMGPNGSGKTTLLRLIGGEIDQTQGTIKRADDLKVVYFDQHRTKLPLTTSLRDALSPKGDYVLFRGQEVHVNGWCKRFLFSPDLLDLPIGKLSGGERARIAIAHLMLQPADLLLLDEPTNDLDIPTLEILEDSLLDFPGALVLITHDRCMLDRVCNSLLALGNPKETPLFADFSQWQAAQKAPPKPKEEKKTEAAPRPKGKLSYLEKKEYEEIEGNISKHEEEVKAFNNLLLDPKVAEDPAQLSELCAKIALAETQIERLYIRWEILEKKLSGSE